MTKFEKWTDKKEKESQELAKKLEASLDKDLLKKTRNSKIVLQLLCLLWLVVGNAVFMAFMGNWIITIIFNVVCLVGLSEAGKE